MTKIWEERENFLLFFFVIKRCCDAVIFLDWVRYLKSSSCLDDLLWIYEMKNGYIYSANVDVYYPDIKFVYDTTKIEMSQYYFDCYYIRNNSKYNITFCRDAVSCLDQAYEWFSKRLLEIWPLVNGNKIDFIRTILD